MKKLLVVALLLSINMLSGCMAKETLTEEELQGLTDTIAGFLMKVDDEFIHIDITKPYIEYAEANNIGFEDFSKDVIVKRTKNIQIVNTHGESLEVEDLEHGTTIYFEYNLEEYDPDTIEIEREKLVVD